MCEFRRNEDFRWCSWRNQFHERYRTRLLHPKCGQWTLPWINNATESLVWKCISHVENRNVSSLFTCAQCTHTCNAWWRRECRKFGIFGSLKWRPRSDELRKSTKSNSCPLRSNETNSRREKNSCNQLDECFDINWVTELTDAPKSIRWQLRVEIHSTHRENCIFLKKKKTHS